jgi:hypothetical protein
MKWPFAPGPVAASLRAAGKGGLANRIEAGQHTVDTAARLGRGALSAVEGGANLASRALAPAVTEGQALAGELGQLGQGVMARPGLVRAGVGALALAPIMGQAFDASRQQHEGASMNAQLNPDKVASLDRFLAQKQDSYEKLASFASTVGWNPSAMGQAWQSEALPSISRHMRESVTSGIGEGIGKSVASAIFNVLKAGYGMAQNALSTDPKRQQLYASLLRSDPVISDAVSRHPGAATTLKEAYTTMVRFAPSLSLDVNAVRSFLREAVVGGSGGVNYATIKSLIETERAHSAGSGSHR